MLAGRSVRNGPGAMQLTVMPCGPRSRALARANPIRALLVAGLGEGAGHRLAEPLAAAGDQGHPARQVEQVLRHDRGPSSCRGVVVSCGIGIATALGLDTPSARRYRPAPYIPREQAGRPG